jgi:hypothetical protein
LPNAILAELDQLFEAMVESDALVQFDWQPIRDADG